MSDLLVELRGIRKVFKSPLLRRPKVALHGIDLALGPGEIFGFLGPNGAGKTTTIKILLGLIKPTSGDGTTLGLPFGSVEARRSMGFLPDAPNLSRYLTGRELLEFTGQLHGIRTRLDERVRETLDRVRLDPDAWDRQLRTYSRGMLQRVGIGVAILHRPKLIVLDEPLNGLDPRGRREFRDLLHALRAEGATILLSSHVLADIEDVADRVGILNRGRLVQCGPLSEFLSTDSRVVEIEFRMGPGQGTRELEASIKRLRQGARGWIGEADCSDASSIVRAILDGGGELLRYDRRRMSLEEFFLQQVSEVSATSEAGGPADRSGTESASSAEPSKSAERLRTSPERRAEEAR